MKIRAKHLIVILLAVLMATASLVIVSHAKQASKGNKGTQILGWCYHDGRISRTTSSMCTGQKGRFFENKNDAQAYLEAQAPGFCCVNGRITASKKSDCLKVKGRFFKDKKAAASWRDLQQVGWCCLNGKILSMKKGNCLKRKGRFFSGKTEAAKYCRDHQPCWCCRDGRVVKTVWGKCGGTGGRAFKDRKAADDWCDLHQSGWCCLDGKITEMLKIDCLKRKGRFYKDKQAAFNSIALPLLIVEKITLKNGTIHLSLNNKGNGKLTAKDYRVGTLSLWFGKVMKSWPLGKIDPRGNLNRGREVTFDTGRKITGRTAVQVAFNYVPGKGASAVLTPPLSGLTKREKALSPNSVVMAGKVKPNVSAPSSAVRRLDRGISILNPVDHGRYYQGETIYIIYRITNEEVTSGTITFSVENRENGHTIGTATASVTSRRTGGPIPLALLENAPVGQHYFLSARHSASESPAYGESDEFEVTRNSVRIDFPAPDRDEIFHRNGTIPVQYRFNRRVAPAVITFQLYHEGAVVATQTRDYHPAPANRRETLYAFNFAIPSDAPHGGYTILATHPHANGFTSKFSILPIGEGSGSAAWGIHISRLRENCMRGSTQTITWVLHGDYPEMRNFTVQLMKGSEVVETIPSDSAQWHGSSKSYSLSWLVSTELALASDYRIKISERNSPVEGVSDFFNVTGSIEVLFGGGTRYLSNRAVIRFRRSISLNPVRIVVVDRSGNEVMAIRNSEHVSSNDEQSYEWKIGANTNDNGVWYYSSNGGSPLHGGQDYAIRVIDTRDPANYGQGSYFHVLYPGIRVSTTEAGRNAIRIHWTAEGLDDSGRVGIFCVFLSTAPAGGVSRYWDVPVNGIMTNAFPIGISRSKPASGSLRWRFGHTCEDRYPPCYKFPNVRNNPAHIIVALRGFGEVVYGYSNSFELSTHGCRWIGDSRPWNPQRHRGGSGRLGE